MTPRPGIGDGCFIDTCGARFDFFIEHERAVQLRDSSHQTQISIACAFSAGRGGGVKCRPVDLGAISNRFEQRLVIALRLH
jgi:hypothetical protein